MHFRTSGRFATALLRRRSGRPGSVHPGGCKTPTQTKPSWTHRGRPLWPLPHDEAVRALEFALDKEIRRRVARIMNVQKMTRRIGGKSAFRAGLLPDEPAPAA